MRVWNELYPVGIVRAVEVLVDPVIAAHLWLRGFAQEVHARLLGIASALAMIAGLTGANQVLPPVRSATVTRHHVVDRQVLRLLAAVLTRIVVPQKDLAASQFGHRMH